MAASGEDYCKLLEQLNSPKPRPARGSMANAAGRKELRRALSWVVAEGAASCSAREVGPAEKLGKPRVAAQRIEERMYLEELRYVRFFICGTP